MALSADPADSAGPLPQPTWMENEADERGSERHWHSRPSATTGGGDVRHGSPSRTALQPFHPPSVNPVRTNVKGKRGTQA